MRCRSLKPHCRNWAESVSLTEKFDFRLWSRLAKKKKANQIVEEMNLPPLRKPKRLTLEEKKNLVGQKRMKGQKVKPISRRGKIITAEFSAQNS